MVQRAAVELRLRPREGVFRRAVGRALDASGRIGLLLDVDRVVGVEVALAVDVAAGGYSVRYDRSRQGCRPTAPARRPVMLPAANWPWRVPGCPRLDAVEPVEGRGQPCVASASMNVYLRGVAGVRMAYAELRRIARRT